MARQIADRRFRRAFFVALYDEFAKKARKPAELFGRLHKKCYLREVIISHPTK